MIKFGPSGNSDSFYAEGHKSTLETPKWVRGLGMDLFEYSFGKGVLISDATALAIGKEAKINNIEISVHAPYYINFANPEEGKGTGGYRYLLQSLASLKLFGGNRVVFHSGTETKQLRAVAFDNIKNRLTAFAQIKKSEGYDDCIICPETMGKLAQIGDIDEIIELCRIDESYYPCVDFGHLNARTMGGLKTAADYEAIVTKMINGLGTEKTKHMHVHFSKIMYGAKGEIRHLTNADQEYGPDFLPLAEVLLKYKLCPHILSESAGTQAEDACEMQQIYRNVAAHTDLQI